MNILPKGLGIYLAGRFCCPSFFCFSFGRTVESADVWLFPVYGYCLFDGICLILNLTCGPGSSVGTATDYGLDGPGIESRWGARFSAPVQTGPGAHPTSVQWVPGLSRG